MYGIKCTTVLWSIVINNCLRLGDFVRAFEVYNQSKTAGITPDAALIVPLLSALAPSRFNTKGPSDESVNRALALYRDFADAVPPSVHHYPSSKPNLNDFSNDPDIDIYNTLFRMLLASRSETDYLSVADSLLKEMEDRHLPTIILIIRVGLPHPKSSLKCEGQKHMQGPWISTVDTNLISTSLTTQHSCGPIVDYLSRVTLRLLVTLLVR
jgi:pentatricopeptide repeat protein